MAGSEQMRGSGIAERENRKALYYEDFHTGQEFATKSRTVTEADIVNFYGLSGDYNPLHTDEEFARVGPDPLHHLLEGFKG